MSQTLDLAHVSDIHLPPLPMPRRGEWRVKRLLGWLNWLRLRRRQHQVQVLRALTDDLKAQSPGHIAVTGDLVNIGLPAEYACAARWLEGLGPPDRVTAIPGNHDIYAELGDDPGTGRWQAYMSGEVDGSGFGYPFVRRIAHVALIGLNSGLVTPPFCAYGRLGAGQLARLAGVLARLGEQGLVRVVLIHHPPLPGQAAPRCALEDADQVASTLARHGAELVLHGHNHRAMLAFAPGPRGPIPVVGAPSASLGLAQGRQTLARYNIYRIAPDGGSAIEMIERGIAAAGGPVLEIGRRRLLPSSASPSGPS